MKLFISYSETDKGVVDKIEQQLKNASITVLRDKNFLKTGEEWEEQINMQIKNCDGFLVVVSKNSIKSENVTDEVIKAKRFNKKIYPFIINNASNFPILEELQHYKYEGSLSTNDIEKIFRLNIDSFDDLSSDVGSSVNKYKENLRYIYNRFNVLNKRQLISIEEMYVDCYLQCGIEFEEQSENFPSSELIDCFNGGLFIITGHPGTGKTSLMKYFTYRLSEQEYNYLPIFIHLKNYSPDFVSFDDFIIANTGNLFNNFDFSFLTQKFKCVLLIDGLDESTPVAYESIKKGINKISITYPMLTVVVTTRINGFKNIREMDYPTAQYFTIAPLEENVIKKYIEIWFSNRDKEIAEKLFNSIIQNKKFFELAQKAIFMLCLMCIVYEGENHLTTNVASLYNRAIKHLLNTRNRISMEERELRIEVLQVIALRFLQMQQRTFDRHLTEAIVQNIIIKKTVKSANEFINAIIDDTGLLQSYEGQYSFAHLTFQEFFVAQATIEGKIFREVNLFDFCNISMWEETFKLYVGLLKSEKDKEIFLKVLSEKNLSLTLRVATDCGGTGIKVLKDIIIQTSTNEKLRMIEEIRNSLITLQIDVAKKLVIETLEPLIRLETDSTVLYYSIGLLNEYDPTDNSRIMYNNFYRYQEEKFAVISSNSDYLFELVSIPAGSFVMGDDNSIDYNEKPAHKVFISSFYVSKYQLTNKAFEYIMNLDSSRRHQQYSSEDNQPVINVDWFDAYICSLRVGCRLLTEAEWEYAARATTTTKWCFGNDEKEIVKYAHCYESKAEKTRAVNEGIPNKWGLYNVHGNVWEWCSDWFDKYSSDEQCDPIGPKDGKLRVRRGGGWLYHARGCKSSFRYGNEPNYKYNDIGIRLAK